MNADQIKQWMLDNGGGCETEYQLAEYYCLENDAYTSDDNVPEEILAIARELLGVAGEE